MDFGLREAMSEVIYHGLFDNTCFYLVFQIREYINNVFIIVYHNIASMI